MPDDIFAIPPFNIPTREPKPGRLIRVMAGRKFTVECWSCGEKLRGDAGYGGDARLLAAIVGGNVDRIECNACGATMEPEPEALRDLLLPSFVMLEDDSGHWYVCRADRRDEARAYFDAPHVAAPPFLVRVGGAPSLVRFPSYVID